MNVGGKWGLIDKTGGVRLQLTYDRIGEFHEGLAPFRQGDRWGYLDRQGTVKIAPRFESVNWFSEGLAAVTPERNEEGLPRSWGFVDCLGRIVIEPRFDSGGLFSEGLAAVKKDGLIGYIDRDGQWAIPPRFHFSWRQPSRDGGAVVRLSKKGEEMALIDTTGAIIRGLGHWFSCGVRYDPGRNGLTGLYADYENSGGDAVTVPFDPGLTKVQEGLLRIFQCEDGVNVAGKALHGFAAATGKVIIPPRFEHVKHFSQGRAAFAVDINWEACQAARPGGW